jgi:uncharacterized membrane protein YidH (DUF202 family)
MTAPDPATRDPARQPERTRLAWHRTVLAVTVVALLAGRLALLEALTPTRVAVVAIVAAGWLLIVLAGTRRVAAMSATAPAAPAAPAPPRWSVRVATVVVLGYAVLGVALVAVP